MGCFQPRKKREKKKEKKKEKECETNAPRSAHKLGFPCLYAVSCFLLTFPLIKARKRWIDSNPNHEYGAIGGSKEFCDAAARLLLGTNSKHIAENKRTTVQTLSGTGALRVAGAFLNRFLPPGTKLMIPDPTWAAHIPIFEDSGFQLLKYRYYRASDCGLDLDGMLEDIDMAPRGSVVLLHVCAHNPTGVDPSQHDWKSISKVVAARDHKVLFDAAYQGFASGDPARDRYPIELFTAEGHEPLICQSFAKNFGMYGERVGSLTVITDSADTSAKVSSLSCHSFSYLTFFVCLFPG
jgi:aspartate aminotransferase